MKPFPTLIVNLETVRSNIRHMADKAKQENIEFRPHFKTHQSKAIGKMFKDVDVSGITVSSLKMANYFADDGWDDITIAFPANVLATTHYDELSKYINLKTLVISREVVSQLDNQLQHPLGLYIEIDPNYGRSGIPISDIESITSVLKAIETSRHLYPAGFYCHAGHTYQARSKDDILKISTPIMNQLKALKEIFPDLDICFGDTPSCSALQSFSPVDQISPGNFVFYDWMQVQIGSCSPNEIAVYLECPVIEKFNARREVLIHGGAVHFSKDSIQTGDLISFGEPRMNHLSEETYLKKISQEHGIVQCSPQVFEKINIGETLQVFPVHSCLTADLMRKYHTEDGEVLDHMNGT